MPRRDQPMLSTCNGSASNVRLLGLLLAVALLAATLPACRGCGPKRLRRYGATCGRNSECAGGVCYQGRCTKSCKDSAECGGGVCIENVCHEPDSDADGDGLSNAFEEAWKLDPGNPDSDGDGRSDGQEIGPNFDVPNDANGDGIIDALQSNIADTDGDCMVDVIDPAPADNTKFKLPSVAQLCDRGVCAESLDDVQVVCRPDSPVQKGVAFGCLGCGCQADKTKIPTWEPDEVACDNLDNDCDGVTDEAQLWLDLPVGATCQVLSGVCGQPDDSGLAPSGKVECMANGKPGCSIELGGSGSVAKKEVCNLADDDCDGDMDEGFQFKGTPVGGPCPGCGETEFLCEDGTPANPPVVACNLAGDKALCGALPFASGFSELGHGSPPPRVHWTATWSPGWKRILVYGGEIPTAHVPVPRADLWTLDPDAGKWQRHLEQAPGHRRRAALVWDEAGDRALLVGGSKDGEPALAVWALNNDLKWQQVSALDPAHGSYVPPLPFALAGKVTRAVVIGDATKRRLFVFSKGLLAFWSATLGGGGKWQATSTSLATKPGIQKLTGAVRCLVTPPGSADHALALMPSSAKGKASLFRLSLDASGDATLALIDEPVGPPDRRDDQCVLDHKGALHIFGGNTPTGLTEGTWHVGTFPGGSSSAGVPTWQTKQASASVVDALTRNVAFSAWSGANGSALITGGFVRMSTQTGIHRVGRNDATRWRPDEDKVETIVAPSPKGRVGQATGRSKSKGSCIAGGLIFDLPDVDGGFCRVRPATDAWCADTKGNWSLITDALPPFAFGIGGVDTPADLMVLAGGYDLAAGGEVHQVRRLWRGQLTFDEVKPLSTQPKVTNAVHTLDLNTGAVQTLSTTGPEIAAGSVVYDPVRRRLISFGGFDNVSPTRAFWRLDLKTMTWRDLSGGAGPMLVQYGSVVVFDPVSNLFGVAGGIQHYVNKEGKDPIAMQFVVSNETSTKTLGPCQGKAEVPMHMTTPIAPAAFQLVKLPAWADPNAANPTKKLFRIHFSQPSFVPTILDPIGRRGLIAVTDVMPAKKLDCEDDPKKKDKDGKQIPCVGPPCPGNTSPQWTDATLQLRVALGQCAGKPRVFLEQGTLANLPTSMFMASTTYDDPVRTSWVWGGLEPDGTPSTTQWKLAQDCKDTKP